MATGISQAPDRRARQRAATIDEALAHAVDIMTADGVGGLSVSEVARRMGMRPPSLYKYFDSLHGIYDALFERANGEHLDAVRKATARLHDDEARLVAGAEATVGWSMKNPALAQLIFWRPVPGYTPSSQAYASARETLTELQAVIAAAIDHGSLRRDTDIDEFVALYTIAVSGIVSQQLANEPNVRFASGRFSRHTPQVVRALLSHYRIQGGRDASGTEQ